ncbi:hypothetical protein Tco_0047126 [Tanacetum coccineum]
MTDSWSSLWKESPSIQTQKANVSSDALLHVGNTWNELEMYYEPCSALEEAQDTIFTNCLKKKKHVGVARSLIRETTTYGKVVYLEDIYYFKDFENQFPVIVYNDALTSEPKVSSDFKNEFPTIVYNDALTSEPEVSSEPMVWICQILQEISQKRTRERMSDQEAKEIKAEAKEIMPQPSTVNCS